MYPHLSTEALMALRAFSQARAAEKELVAAQEGLSDAKKLVDQYVAQVSVDELLSLFMAMLHLSHHPAVHPDIVERAQARINTFEMRWKIKEARAQPNPHSALSAMWNEMMADLTWEDSRDEIPDELRPAWDGLTRELKKVLTQIPLTQVCSVLFLIQAGQITEDDIEMTKVNGIQTIVLNQTVTPPVSPSDMTVN